MPQYNYTRAAVPVTENILLEVVFKDSAGNPKDPDTDPEIEITDAATAIVVSMTDSGITRTAIGHYRIDFTVPTGYTTGMWNDHWQANLDGYTISNVFDFNVTSAGSVEETGASVPPVEYTLDSPDLQPEYTQEEIKCILKLRGLLKTKLRSTAYKPDGSTCPVFSDAMLNDFLRASLSELNATPTLTCYRFSDHVVCCLAADLITQGAMLIAWAGQAIIEAGFEFTVNDNGVTVNPPPVSAAINTQYSAQLSDYRSKLREFKRNIRPGPLGMGAGSFLVRSPQIMRLRHLKERRLL